CLPSLIAHRDLVGDPASGLRRLLTRLDTEGLRPWTRSRSRSRPRPRPWPWSRPRRPSEGTRRDRSGIGRSVHRVLEAAHEDLIADAPDGLTEGSARRVPDLEARVPGSVALLEEIGRPIPSRARAVEGGADQDA